ncbi:MAG: GAF domain-containing protein, partial [Planctomycetales bacterium]|nr:GAF domain-containing protein [Planctomycetales bacterium]
MSTVATDSNAVEFACPPGTGDDLPAKIAEVERNYHAVLRVAQTLAGAHSSGRALASALDATCDAFGWDYAACWRRSESETAMEFVVDSGQAGRDLQALNAQAEIAKGEGMVGRAWQTGDFQVVDNAADASQCPRALAARKGGLECYIAMPIVADGRTFGVLEFFAAKPQELTPATRDSLNSIGELVAKVVELIDSSSRMDAMIDNAPVNIMRADRDLVIRYMNTSSRETLKTLEALLPCKVDQIVGQSVDIFHEDPAHQRRLLSDEKNLPHRATISLGEEKLDLLVTATRDSEGRYLGPMVTWEVITEKVRLEAAAAEKSAIVENAPINILLANTDGEIIYMNPASEETLRTIEHLLPVKVSEVVGSSYDVFHVNPQAQRRLLADPRNLPHTAEIQVADETLSLNAAAIYDAQGNYAGPMVSWEIITDQKRAQERERQNQERERTAQRELQEKVDKLLQVVNAAADGDLTQVIDVDGDDAIGALAGGLRRMIGDLSEIIGQVIDGAAQFTEGARVVAESSQSLAEGAQTQSASVEEMSASVDQLAKSIETVKDNAGEANQVAHETSELAEEGGTAVQKSIEAMERIKASS